MKHEGLKRQGSLYVLAVLCVAVASAVIVPRLWPQANQACTEYTRAFAENFDTVNFKDAGQSSVAQWPTGPITLPRLGANFVVGSADRMGRRIYQCAAGDFTGDGYPDLIGLDITGEFPVTGSNPWSELRLIKNIYPTNRGALPLFQVDMTTSYDKFYTHTSPSSIAVGDYNGDGLLDFFFMRNGADEFGYTNFLATMYINTGTRTVPAFRPYNSSPNLNPLPGGPHLPPLGGQSRLHRGYRQGRRPRHPGHQPGQDLPPPQSRGRQLQPRCLDDQRAGL
jgi:hypothetical protein